MAKKAKEEKLGRGAAAYIEAGRLQAAEHVIIT